ncbi:hypothetical protein [uncultured Neptuniibacter sp.]|uniref:hypothetical protein n=1 Tax=uncultured Neptuniibacter sp. TaxID=502143 RepID=UPI002601C685|nr:hypothetical protein [uncultured Neptuniibacter sp.]
MEDKYTTREHTAFAHKFTRHAIASILGAIFSMGLCIAAGVNDLNVWSAFFAVIMVGCAIYALGYLRYRLMHVHCPECNTLCETYNDKTIRQWIANCHRCNIRWKLGVGSKSTSNIN